GPRDAIARAPGHDSARPTEEGRRAHEIRLTDRGPVSNSNSRLSGGPARANPAGRCGLRRSDPESAHHVMTHSAVVVPPTGRSSLAPADTGHVRGTQSTARN